MSDRELLVYVDLAGAGFELAILMGGIIIGGYVDKTKEYKKVTLVCLAVAAFTVIPLGLTEHAIGKEPLLLLLALLVRSCRLFVPKPALACCTDNMFFRLYFHSRLCQGLGLAVGPVVRIMRKRRGFQADVASRLWLPD